MFPQFFDSAPDALIVVDGDGTIVLANPQAERLFGYPPTGLERMSIESLMPPAARERHKAHRTGYMLGPRIRPMGSRGQALTGQRRDGAQFPVEIALSPIQTEHGTRYLASIRDVSQTQRARQTLVRGRYDMLVARVGHMALEAADETSTIEAVPALLAEALRIETLAVVFLGSDGDNVELRASIGLDSDWPDPTPRGPTLARALANGEPLVLEDAADGGQLPFPVIAGARSAASVPMLDRDRPMGALVAMSSQPRRFDHDALHLLQSVAHLIAALVQRRRTEEQLAHSQRLDAIGQLTGGIAHDFNNLLTIISGSLELLAEEPAQTAQATELIDGAMRSVARGAELTAQLLAFARRQRLNPSAVDPRGLLRELQSMLGRTLGESIRITVECAEPLPCAYADAMQLDTSLVNLALNARDAMPRGGELALVATERRIAAGESRPELPAGRYIVFSVCDTGHGMSEDTRTRAIEPFFTTKDLGRGSGLGLSMVYGFVRQSGGYLHVESQLGYGTRVDLYLPVAPTADPGQSAQKRSASVPASATEVDRGGGETVLVVEDESAVRRIATNFLQSLGYRVVGATSAEEALRQLRLDPEIDLLFSDIMLGSGIDGAQLARAARTLRPNLAVLLTSGRARSAGDQQRAETFEVLRKPYRREQLAAAVRRHLATMPSPDLRPDG